MGLMVEQGGAFDEYEAVALPPGPGPEASGRPRGPANPSLGSAVFLRRSARPSRRAVLHLDDLTGSFAPADLARWYNERGFHFYVTDVDAREPHEGTVRRRTPRSMRAGFAALDAACRHLRQADGIDAIILSAQGDAASAAALWCHARRAVRPVDALILSNPDFGKGMRGRLDIACPVLVISAAGPEGSRAAASRADRRERRGAGGLRLGQHVTWLHLDQDPRPAVGHEAPRPAAGQEGQTAKGAADVAAARKRLFDEMGRWLGAYMYGQVRDQLL